MRKGELCEKLMQEKYKSDGCVIIPTGKGSDFLTLCEPDNRPTFVEVKDGCKSNLTKFQKEFREKVLKEKIADYKVERCGC